jgi:hypothetical protein
MQNAILVKENITKEIDRKKQASTVAYNQLEELLFITTSLKPRARDIQPYIDKIDKNYVLFRQSINSMRFTTDIYQSRKWYEGCTLCEIKIYGDLVKTMTRLQDLIFEIDGEVTNAFTLLSAALDGAADSHELITKQKPMRELDINYMSRQRLLEELRHRANDNYETQRIKVENITY